MNEIQRQRQRLALLSVKEAKLQRCEAFCEASHDSLNCETTISMDLKKRFQAVKGKQGCFNCLKVGHNYKKVLVITKTKCAWCSKGLLNIIC